MFLRFLLGDYFIDLSFTVFTLQGSLNRRPPSIIRRTTRIAEQRDRTGRFIPPSLRSIGSSPR